MLILQPFRPKVPLCFSPSPSHSESLSWANHPICVEFYISSRLPSKGVHFLFNQDCKHDRIWKLDTYTKGLLKMPDEWLLSSWSPVDEQWLPPVLLPFRMLELGDYFCKSSGVTGFISVSTVPSLGPLLQCTLPSCLLACSIPFAPLFPSLRRYQFKVELVWSQGRP